MSRQPFILPLIIALVLIQTRSTSGPVPGVDTGENRTDGFAHPGHLSIAKTTEDDFLVTFRWTPGAPVTGAAIAGSFNDWSRTSLPMDDPEGDGTWEVTTRLPEGSHEYKFVSDPGRWFTDSLNPEGTSDGVGGRNSILRLGRGASPDGKKHARGDGRIDEDAFHHDPAEATFFDALTSDGLTLRVRVLRDDVEAVDLVLWSAKGASTRLPMPLVAVDEAYAFHETHLQRPAEAGADAKPAVAYGFAARDGDVETLLSTRFPLVFDPARIVRTPDWARRAIWYQIMVDRFRNGDPSNDPPRLTGSSTNRSDHLHPWTSDWYTTQPWETAGGRTFWEWSVYDRLYGGDFQGVIDKLDYLQDLGITAIYLNPVFEAGQAHKYNARTYVFADDGYGVAGEFDKSIGKIDQFGPDTWFFNASDRKLLELIDEVHRRGMRIILDGVWNHLGEDAISFLDVKANGRASRFADWYEVRSWDPFEYAGWGGFGGLPQFAKDPAKGLASESLIRHIHAVTRRWMDPDGDGDPCDGIDGWRLDVPMEIPMPFWIEWAGHVKSINPDALIIGEVWNPAEEWLDGTKLDGVMNYPWAEIAFRFFGNREQRITASEFDSELARLRIRYPRASTLVLQNLFDSHDTDRWVSRLANPDLGYDEANRIQDNGPEYRDGRPAEEHYRRLKLMALFQATYVGAPMIWYGTEVGMFGADDPMCRMPMWWDDLMPYDNPDYRTRDDLRDMFRELFRLRRANEALMTGEYRTLLADDSRDCIVYLRYLSGNESGYLIALNNSDREQVLDLPLWPRGLAASGYEGIRVLYGEEACEWQTPEADGQPRLLLKPVSGAIMKLGTPAPESHP